MEKLMKKLMEKSMEVDRGGEEDCFRCCLLTVQCERWALLRPKMWILEIARV